MARRKINKSDIIDYEDIEEIEKDYGSVYDDLADPLDTTDNSRWELNEDVLVNQIINNLKRRVMTSKGMKTPKNIPPLVNDKGISDIATFLRFHLNKIIALSNLTEDDIRVYAIDIVNAFILMMKLERVNWELEKSYRKSIVISFDEIITAHLKRAYKQGERVYRTKRMPMKEQFSHDEIRPDEIGLLNSNQLQNSEGGIRL